MKASSQNKLTLEVTTENESAEVFIIDGRFKVVDKGRSLHNTYSLAPGIYTVKVRAGFETREQHVVLLNKPEHVKFPRIDFPSPAPLAGTAQTHEYHMDAAATQSRKVHLKKGHGSSIYVFVREWTSPQRSGAGNEPNQRPQRGLKLFDARGELVADLEGACEFSENDDAWAACNVELDPGVYRLGLELASGDMLEQTVVASEGWQTQVFLLQRNYGEGAPDRRADLLGASILLSNNGFDRNDPKKRLVEAARLGLINTQQVLSERVVNEIVNGKFENPMLGILGAHLLLLDKQIKLGLLGVVVNTLRRMLGVNQHPDVEALALRLGKSETSYIFESPPMLRRSWWQVVDATIDRPDLIPLGSVSARCADRIWGGEPWLQWMIPEKERNVWAVQQTAAESAFESMAEASSVAALIAQFDLGAGSAVSFEPQGLALGATVGGRELATKLRKRTGKKSSRLKLVSLPESEKPRTKFRPTKSEMRKLVKSSGLPSANVRMLLDQYEQNKSTSDTETMPDPATEPT